MMCCISRGQLESVMEPLTVSTRARVSSVVRVSSSVMQVECVETLVVAGDVLGRAHEPVSQVTRRPLRGQRLYVQLVKMGRAWSPAPATRPRIHTRPTPASFTHIVQHGKVGVEVVRLCGNAVLIDDVSNHGIDARLDVARHSTILIVDQLPVFGGLVDEDIGAGLVGDLLRSGVSHAVQQVVEDNVASLPLKVEIDGRSRVFGNAPGERTFYEATIDKIPAGQLDDLVRLPGDCRQVVLAAGATAKR